MLADTVATQQEDPHAPHLIAIQQQTQQLQKFCDEFCEEVRALRVNFSKGLSHSKRVLLNHEDEMKHTSAYLSSFDHSRHDSHHASPVDPQWNAGNIATIMDYQVPFEEQVSDTLATTPFLQITPAFPHQHDRQEINDIRIGDRHDGLARQAKYWDLALATGGQNMLSGRATDIYESAFSSSLSDDTASSLICPLDRSEGVDLTQDHVFHSPPSTMPRGFDSRETIGTHGHMEGYQVEKFWTREPHILLVEAHHESLDQVSY